MSDPQASQPPNGGAGGAAKALRRYGPIGVIVVVIGAIAIGAAMKNNNNDSNKKVTAGSGTTGTTSNLPITFQDAKAQGKTIDFGPTCDPKTGRVAIPLLTAPQCVQPWDATKSNGGATAPGVTATSIKVAVYVGQNDPLQQALVGSAGASTSPTDYYKTDVGYLKGFEKAFQMYGRKLDIVRVDASGGPADHAAALADAVKIRQLKPFAVIGGPAQAPEFWRQMAKAKILCIGSCSVAASEIQVNANAPYVWPQGIAPEQDDDLLAEMVGKQLAGKNAVYAGDTKMHSKKRVFGWIQAQTENGQFVKRNARLFKELNDKYGVTVKATVTYLFDPSQAQNIARTVINKMKAAGVTTIMVSADPLIPANYTQEATAQDYFPEWVIAPSVYVDTSIFGRTYDQKQWAHAFGITALPARGPREEGESFSIYKWFTGGPPPINAQGIPYARASLFMIGVHLAGPNLTPETFKEGMFRYLPNGSSPTRPYVSWGTKLWPDPDYHNIDDAAMIWWDPKAYGQDEVGKLGNGEYRFVNMGTRYLPGKWPTAPVKWFDPANTITVFNHNPPEDTPPSYPAPTPTP
ncbi:MAG: hypothetical protein JWL83_1682 [Actinomycetia bacterium]|nr:hypothetical protein [Actinomycetes bacterium]